MLATTDRQICSETPFLNLAGDYSTMRSYCNEVEGVLQQATFDITDGDSEELFGAAPFVLDEGIYSKAGVARRYVSPRDAIHAQST